MSVYKYEVNDGQIICELDKFAKQADGSVLIGFGDIRVLVTVCEKEDNQDRDFFPLTVNYEEKLYSVGKVPGNYKRREGQPSEQATLSARMIDRPLRPLFPSSYTNEVQVICEVLSTDESRQEDVYATIGASLALMTAQNIPFEGPIACVNVGYIDEEFIVNPSYEQLEDSSLELKIAGSYDAINMVEAGADEISEELMVKALLFGHQEIKKIVTWQNEILKQRETEKVKYEEVINDEYETIYEFLNSKYYDNVQETLKIVNKKNRNEKLDSLKDSIILEYAQEDNAKYYERAFDNITKEVFRKLIINEKYRVDGRKIDELRQLTSEIDILPVVHGSGMFTRGETQVLNVLTLGLSSDAQTFDGLEYEKEKRFLLHYNFPPFSVGETGRMGSPGRREIGHGNLALKALTPVLPSKEDFPYTIRLVSEVLESNGSSSQATICSGSLALMAGGVPIKKQVAGIAMGLIADNDDYTILTDIQGLEDHLGDMDFKVAGTKDGITAIQMDIKIKGISEQILVEALEQAKVARFQILENMNKVIDKPRTEMSDNVLKVNSFHIEVSKIRDVIGRGGDMINKIIEDTGVKIDIEEDGQVYIYSTEKDMVDKAKETILKIAKVYKKGEKYTATVVRIETYGAFVNLSDGGDALLHISDLSDKRVEKVTDILAMNDKIEVEIKEVDSKNRVKVKLIKKD